MVYQEEFFNSKKEDAMNIIRILAGIFSLCFFSGCSFGLLQKNIPKWKSSREIAQCIRDPQCRTTHVVAHRGNGFGAPENSREAISRAIEHEIFFVEIDLRKSADGKIFVIHDHNLSNTTNRKGDIRKMTSSELADVFLANGEHLPRFEDMYAVSRAQVILVLDFKNNFIEEMTEWIHMHGSFNDVIFYASSKKETESAARAKKIYPEMMVMVDLHSLGDVGYLERLFGKLPEILAVRFPLTLTAASRLRPYGVKLCADSLVVPPPFQIIPLEILLTFRMDFIMVNHPLFLQSLL